jgi:hypothetical protein
VPPANLALHRRFPHDDENVEAMPPKKAAATVRYIGNPSPMASGSKASGNVSSTTNRIGRFGLARMAKTTPTTMPMASAPTTGPALRPAEVPLGVDRAKDGHDGLAP